MDGSEDQPAAIVVLNVGGVDRDTDQQAGSTGNDVTLAALDLLRGIVATGSVAFGRLNRLAVDDTMTPTERLGSRPAASHAYTSS
jgi:hypothetical protein